MKLTLEEILTLSAVINARAVSDQMNNARAVFNGRQPDDYFWCSELDILTSSIKWMTDAAKLYNEKASEYAGLTLAEFIAQSRPK